MSRAFVREGEYRDLHEITPTMASLIAFLTDENGGIRVYEKKQLKGPDGDIVHEMSNGLRYRVNDENKWEAV